MFDHLYLIVTGAGTARECPALAARLMPLVEHLTVVLTPNAERVVAPREFTLAFGDRPGYRLVESYFDVAILPRPPHGAVLVAPCSFASLNKLAAGIADNLALSIVSEAIGRRTPVTVAVSVNQPLWDHPIAAESVARLRAWGVRVHEPRTIEDRLTMVDIDLLVEAARSMLRGAPGGP